MPRLQQIWSVTLIVALSFVIAYFLLGTAYLVYALPLWGYAIIAAVCALLPVYLSRRLPLAQRGLVLGVYVLLVAFGWTWSGDTRRPFLRDLYSVKPGMSVSQVNARMRRWMTYANLREGTGTISFRHANDSAFGADVGWVKVRHGRVTSVEFSPD